MPKQNLFAVGHGSCRATQHVYRPFAATRPCINITMGTHHGQRTSLATVQGQCAFAWAGAAARFPTVLDPLIGRDSVQLSPAVPQRHAAGPLQVEGRPLAIWLCGAETSAGLPHLTRFFRRGHDGRTRRWMIRSTGSAFKPPSSDFGPSASITFATVHAHLPRARFVLFARMPTGVS